MRIIQIVNSSYGVRNAIGARPMQVARQLGKDDELLVLARGATEEARESYDIRQCGLGSFMGKVLKGANVYLWRGFPHKKILQRRFEADAERWLRTLPIERYDVIHTWAEIPEIVAEAKRRNPRLVVIRDVSMRPECAAPGFGPGAGDTVQRDAWSVDYFLAPSEIVARTMIERCGVEEGRIFTEPFGVDTELFRPSWFSAAPAAGDSLASRRGTAPAAGDSLVSRRGAAPAAGDGWASRRGTAPAAGEGSRGSGSRAPEAQRAVRGAPKPFSVAFSGHLDRRKGIPELMAAWNLLRFREAELHLYGRVYPEIKSYLKGSRQRGVHVRGFVDLPGELPKHDLFVLPSHREGSAKAVYEALACGLPVVTTPEAGSVVRNGVEGLIVPAGDVGALVGAIRYYYENPEPREEAAAAARARAKEYTWERYGKAVAEVYRKAAELGPWEGRQEGARPGTPAENQAREENQAEEGERESEAEGKGEPAEGGDETA